MADTGDGPTAGPEVPGNICRTEWEQQEAHATPYSLSSNQLPKDAEAKHEAKAEDAVDEALGNHVAHVATAGLRVRPVRHRCPVADARRTHCGPE